MENYNDDPQLAELKQWWSEYGRSVLFGVTLAVVTLGCWNFWNSYQNQQTEQASTIYYNMMESYDALEKAIVEDKVNESLEESVEGDNVGERPSDKPSEKIAKLAEFQSAVTSLKEQYAKTEYAHYALFQNAKYLVGEKDYPAAAEELKTLINNGPNDSIKILAQLRLTRVLFAAGKYAEALQLTEMKDLGVYESDFKELAGDIYATQGDSDKAFKAYALAKDASETPSETLDMKYYNLLSE